MIIGTSKQQRKDLESSSNIMSDLIDIVDGDNVIRFVQGPQLTKVVFLPIVKEDDTEGLVPSWSVFKFKDSGGILDQLYQVEMGIRNALGEKEPDFAFRPQTQRIYLGYQPLDKTKNTLRPIKVPKKIQDELNRKETQLDPGDKDYLLNGFFWLWDSLITKFQKVGKNGKKMSARFGTDYQHDIYLDNPWKGKVPAEWLNADPSEVLDELGGLEAVFPDRIIEAIETCDIDLSKELKPMTEAEIMEQITKYPINLSYIQPNTQNYKFPQVQEFVDSLQSLGID